MREMKVEWYDLEGEKMNFGNGIIEIRSSAQALPVKCSSGSARMRFTNCGNQVAKIVGNWGKGKYELWQPSCRKWEEKKLWLPKSEEELKKQKNATSTIFLQYFHNKSQVISCH